MQQFKNPPFALKLFLFKFQSSLSCKAMLFPGNWLKFKKQHKLLVLHEEQIKMAGNRAISDEINGGILLINRSAILIKILIIRIKIF